MLLLNCTVKSFRLLTSFPLKPPFPLDGEFSPLGPETRSLQTCPVQVGVCPSRPEAHAFTEKVRVRQTQHLLGECPVAPLPAPQCSARSHTAVPAARASTPAMSAPSRCDCVSIKPHVGACVRPARVRPPRGQCLARACHRRASPQPARGCSPRRRPGRLHRGFQREESTCWELADFRL